MINLMSAGVLAMVLSGCENGNENNGCDEAVKVKTLTVEHTSARQGRRYSGTIEENTGTDVSFASVGTVDQVLVSNGQRVYKGQLLATLDATTLQNAYNASLSLLNQAQDAYERMKQLYETNSIPEIQWVDVQSKLEQAKSSEQMARRALSDTRIVAPASGIITNKNLEPGQNVIPGLTVMKIVEIDKVKVNISVPEREVGAIGQSNEVEIVVSALGDAQFTGQVVEKNVTANALSRTYTIKASVNNPEHQLMPGMICEARVNGVDTGDSLISLPIDAVQLSDKNFYYVWLEQDGLARKQYVTVYNMTPKGVTILSGLKRGDNVIVEGQQKVSEGMEVEVTK